MNLIFVTGAPRCGKTTYANRLNNILENSSILSLDALSKACRFTFDDFELYSRKGLIKPDMNLDTFKNIIRTYVDEFMNDYPQSTLIVEGCHLSPSDIKSLFNVCKIICLGCDDKEKIIKSINAKPWMSKLTDYEKEQYAQFILKESLEYKADSIKDNYYYFDISEINTKGDV